MKAPLFTLLAAVLIFNTVGCGKGTAPGYHLNAVFTSPQNLKPGDPVMMAGLQIGNVESIALDPSRAEICVPMRIQRSSTVKTDSTASMNFVVSSGRSSIVLDGGSTGAPAAQPNTILITKEKPGSVN